MKKKVDSELASVFQSEIILPLVKLLREKPQERGIEFNEGSIKVADSLGGMDSISFTITPRIDKRQIYEMRIRDNRSGVNWECSRKTPGKPFICSKIELLNKKSSDGAETPKTTERHRYFGLGSPELQGGLKDVATFIGNAMRLTNGKEDSERKNKQV